MKIAILWGEFIWCVKWAFFFVAGRDSPPIYRVFPQGQSTHSGGKKQDESRWKTFGKMGNLGGIIQGNNSAGHWFVLRDLGSISKKTFVMLNEFWPVRGRGEGGGRFEWIRCDNNLVDRQNLLSVTKVICRWSLNSNELFQISHDYETIKCAPQTKFLATFI